MKPRTTPITRLARLQRGEDPVSSHLRRSVRGARSTLPVVVGEAGAVRDRTVLKAWSQQRGHPKSLPMPWCLGGWSCANPRGRAPDL